MQQPHTRSWKGGAGAPRRYVIRVEGDNIEVEKIDEAAKACERHLPKLNGSFTIVASVSMSLRIRSALL
jgi:hypothetical protein